MILPEFHLYLNGLKITENTIDEINDIKYSIFLVFAYQYNKITNICGIMRRMDLSCKSIITTTIKGIVNINLSIAMNIAAIINKIIK